MCATTSLAIAGGELLSGDNDPLGRVAARRLASLSAMRRVRYHLEPRCEQAAQADPNARRISLAQWARAHIESQLDAQYARSLLAELAGPPLSIAAQESPPAALCDEIDRRILAALDTPQPLHALWRQARTSRFRLLSFLHFLRAVGALNVGQQRTAPRPPQTASAGAAHRHASSSTAREQAAGLAPTHERNASGPRPARASTHTGLNPARACSSSGAGRAQTNARPESARPEPTRRATTRPGANRSHTSPIHIGDRDASRDAARQLGVPVGADRETIRRAFHKRARALHPDLQPNLSRAQQRQLELALADIADAYETLLSAAPRGPRSS